MVAMEDNATEWLLFVQGYIYNTKMHENPGGEKMAHLFTSGLLNNYRT